jgi:CPA2 family monovalent cation:H+ antiporter-2
VVLTRVLSDVDELHTPAGNIAIGWLVVQDIFAVLVLVLMPVTFGNEGDDRSLPVMLLTALGKIAVLIAIVIFAGGRLIPWLLRHVAASRSRELFTLTILVVALGIAVLSAKLFAVSMALGAFLAGMVVGRSDFSTRAATEALPMRDAFAVLFFVSVGMLFDPKVLVNAPGLVAATLAVVMLGTPLVTLAFMLVRRYPFQVAATLALALAQIGEFSFMLAALARKYELISPQVVHAIVAVAILSISVNPLLHRLVNPLNRWVSRHKTVGPWLAARARHAPVGPHHAHADDIDPLYRAVIVGYGPVGRTLARLLKQNDVEPTIIDMNLQTVNQLRAEGKRAVYGDANHHETLRQAGVHQAGTLILSASGLQGGDEVIRLARELNPRLRILVRSAYLRERQPLLKAGADAVFAGEGEVALAMVENVLTELGATPDQIDDERDQVRSEFFGADEPLVPATTLATPNGATAPDASPSPQEIRDAEVAVVAEEQSKESEANPTSASEKATTTPGSTP